MKKFILLLAAFAPTYFHAMSSPGVMHRPAICHTIKDVVDQIAEYENLSAQDKIILEQRLLMCPQKNAQPSNRSGFEKRVTLDFLNALHPFIKRGGAPFLDHCLFEAIRENNLESVITLVNNLRVSANAIDARSSQIKTGMPALHLAVIGDHEKSVDILDFLLQKGAETESLFCNPNASPLSYTPLGYLLFLLSFNIASNPEEKVALLLRHGANYDALTNKSHSFDKVFDMQYKECKNVWRWSSDQLAGLTAEHCAVRTKIATEKAAGQAKGVLDPHLKGHEEIIGLINQYAYEHRAQAEQKKKRFQGCGQEYEEEEEEKL